MFQKDSTRGSEFSDLYTREIEIPLRDIEKSLKENNRLKSPIPVTKEIQSFRESILPLLKVGNSVRESTVRWMEARLRMLSLEKINIFQNRKSAQYDVVIVGSGVHGITALHEIMNINPNLKVLVIDKSNTAGATFRKAGATFNINSSNRSSGKNSEPLPGKGNINELSGSPVQVSELTNVKYPSALDLGDALVTSLYGALSSYKNVDIIFNTTVRGVEVNQANVFANRIQVDNKSLPDGFEVRAQKIILASGLGKPRIPREIQDQIKADPQLTVTPKAKNKLPRVVTFEDVLRTLQKSSNPKSYFANKRVAVVGTGDSANVLIEFLLGYSTKEGYAQSDAQTPNPKKILWLGQCRTTCDSFIADARSRYAQIGTGFRSSDPQTSPILEGVPGRLMEVERVSRKGVKAITESNTFEVDTIILTTGYSNRLVDILKNLIRDNSDTADLTTLEFFENYGEFLEGVTSVSNKQVVRVARTFAEGRIIVIGPSAGKLPTDGELVGIIQNSVSIFNNAPRSQAAAGILVKGLEAKARPPVRNQAISQRIEKTEIVIDNIGSIRLVGTATHSHLNQLVSAAVDITRIKPSQLNTYSFKILKREGRLVMSSENGFPALTRLADSLLETSNFFPLVLKTLNLVENAEVSFRVEFNKEGVKVSNSFD